MIHVEASRPLEKALNFNSENIFEYIDEMLFQVNANQFGTQAEETLLHLFQYIKTLPISDMDSIVFEVDAMVNKALSETSSYAYRAGFMEACRLLKTLQSF